MCSGEFGPLFFNTLNEIGHSGQAALCKRISVSHHVVTTTRSGRHRDRLHVVVQHVSEPPVLQAFVIQSNAASGGYEFGVSATQQKQRIPMQQLALGTRRQ